MAESKLIHIVGGGAGQLPLVMKARRNGLTVLVTDMYPDSPCREFADYYVVVDTTDKDGTLAAASHYGIDAIATDQTDVAVPTVAYVAEHLGLPGISQEVANRFTNKRLMREACAKAVPGAIPNYRYFTSCVEARDYINRCPAPVIIKPVSSQGSKGVFKCDTYDEAKLVTTFKESRGQGILVEEFIPGQEIALESFTREGETQVLAISRKQHYRHNDCIDQRVLFFDDLDRHLSQIAMKLNMEIVKALGLANGVTHAEYMIHQNQLYLIEIAARGAGSGISGIIVPEITAFDVNQFILDCAFNKTHRQYPVRLQDKYALLEFMEFTPGKVKDIAVDADAVASAEAFQLNIDKGDIIHPVGDSRDRNGFFIVIDESVQQVEEKAKALRTAVEIVYE